MKKEIEQYYAEPGKKRTLKHYATNYSGQQDKQQGEKELAEVKGRLSLFQEKLYAANSHSLLIIFQAMDTAGKDGAIEHVMSGLNPQGCEVYSFKTPNAAEYAHDFLWRHTLALPAKGKIGIHNRSHYENVLVCKVHPQYILSERIPGYTNVKNIDKKFWKNRYESIRNYESHLVKNGTVIIKFFLHLSKEEQMKRLIDRINDPKKNWKFSVGDLAERKLWGNYMKAYEQAIQETSTKEAPWFIIPADDKWHARLAISKIMEDTLESLNLQFPELEKAQVAQLQEIKKKLLKDN